MGYRKHMFTHRKSYERKRLGAGMLKSSGGRPKKNHCKRPEPQDPVVSLQVITTNSVAVRDTDIISLLDLNAGNRTLR